MSPGHTKKLVTPAPKQCSSPAPCARVANAPVTPRHACRRRAMTGLAGALFQRMLIGTAARSRQWNSPGCAPRPARRADRGGALAITPGVYGFCRQACRRRWPAKIWPLAKKMLTCTAPECGYGERRNEHHQRFAWLPTPCVNSSTSSPPSNAAASPRRHASCTSRSRRSPRRSRAWKKASVCSCSSVTTPRGSRSPRVGRALLPQGAGTAAHGA